MSLKELFDHISAGTLEPAKALLSSGTVSINDVDEHGMTALQHASYKGCHHITQMLLDQGADVSWDGHEHGYTALHFAALSGSEPTVRALLVAGARTDATNSVKRTPAQMAAFVGNHRVVALINNFVPRSLIDYYTVPRGQETQPKLAPALAAPTHHLLMQVNLNPVHIVAVLRQSSLLFCSLRSVSRVLELICEREVRDVSGDGDETLAMRAHYLSCVLLSLDETRRALAASRPDQTDLTELVYDRHVRAWLRYNDAMVEEYQENYVRQCIKSFPCRDAPLLQQLVANLARAPPAAQQTTALGLLAAALNGQRAFQDEKQCSVCGEEGGTRRCAACRAVQYCGRQCQRAHWFTHKRFCATLAARTVEYERKQAAAAAAEGDGEAVAEAEAGEKASIPAEAEADVKASIPAEVGPDVKASIPAEVDADVKASIPAEVEAGVKASIPAEVEADVKASIPAEVEADVKASLPAKVEADVKASIPAKVEADVKASIPAEVEEAGVKASIPAEVEAGVKAPVPAEVEADVKASIPAEVEEAGVKASVPAEVEADVKASVPVGCVAGEVEAGVNAPALAGCGDAKENNGSADDTNVECST